MTVYELIQELTAFRADDEVEVSFKSEDKYVDCSTCENEIKVEGDDVTARDYGIRRINRTVYIEAEE